MGNNVFEVVDEIVESELDMALGNIVKQISDFVESNGVTPEESALTRLILDTIDRNPISFSDIQMKIRNLKLG